MKRILIVGSLLAASHAWAADLPVPAGPVPAYYPVATVYDWGGGYIGINGGYAFGQSEWGADPLNPSGLSSTGNFNVNGGLLGGTIGVSGQWGAWVFGVEGDFDWQGLSGRQQQCVLHQHPYFPLCWIDRRGIELQDREQLAGNAPRALRLRVGPRSRLRDRRRRGCECGDGPDRPAVPGQP
jgi:hypothetical protein